VTTAFLLPCFSLTVDFGFLVISTRGATVSIVNVADAGEGSALPA
jgi:hypothetical protein